VNVGPRAGFPHDRSGAPDMIRVAMSENQVLELVGPMAKAADLLEDGGLLVRGKEERLCGFLLQL